ncbi:MAG TPA: rhodanese-like domain-containing protein [Rhodococcus sp. (in: high G+C Gram-positive bacteria)]|uniref:rhodanese-like domain-containing protein n=1 Tax=Rhodococcus sp. SJ-3 TaxID=3454628 RepID=UPI002DAFD9C4|nr:rhodanese-like domain-containing protein [Rhodococcus sp. (in: high G+C Gram-positive bacteria)]
MRAALVSSFSSSPSAPVALLPLAVERTYPTELAAAVARGAVIVDVRSTAQRDAQGTLPGALAISEELVTARLDPANPGRLAVAVDLDVEWILVSAEGTDSHRLVASLQQRGLRRVSHMAGGYHAILAARMVQAVTQAHHILADVERVTAH